MGKLNSINIGSNKSKKHPKCLGSSSWSPDSGYDYDCEYNTSIECGECKYGAGRKDPEAKRNQMENWNG